MILRPQFIIPLVFLFSCLPLCAAPPGNQEQEYQQVRKIALRDPKVRAAYDEADRRLEAKIMQIDPALSSYVQTRMRNAHEAPPTKMDAPPKAVAKAPHDTTHGKVHVVAKGETLGSIARQYGVTVASLKAANHISDEKKLGVGHVLDIPGRTKNAAPEKKKSLW